MGPKIGIYTVERHQDYAPLLRTLWSAAKAGSIEVISSELSLMETLVGPLKFNNAAVLADFEQFFQQKDLSLLPISQSILREAARLRAAVPALRTPDAIHAATGLLSGCAMFLTNDTGFRRIPGLPLTLLDDVLAA